MYLQRDSREWGHSSRPPWARPVPPAPGAPGSRVGQIGGHTKGCPDVGWMARPSLLTLPAVPGGGNWAGPTLGCTDPVGRPAKPREPGVLLPMPTRACPVPSLPPATSSSPPKPSARSTCPLGVTSSQAADTPPAQKPRAPWSGPAHLGSLPCSRLPGMPLGPAALALEVLALTCKCVWLSAKRSDVG